MKSIKVIFKILAVVFYLMGISLVLHGCVSLVANQKLAEVQGNLQLINFHSDQAADLIWQPGEIGIEAAPHYSRETDLSKINAKYLYSYGKPQQIVFMTSLCNNLNLAHAFKSVKLISEGDTVDPKHVKIIVNFVKTRVGNIDDFSSVYLTVHLSVLKSHQKFTRRFFVYSKDRLEENFWSGASFQKRQAVASQRLMNDILRALNAWGHGH